MIRAVIDTNVLVSGLLSPAGNKALILLATRRNQILWLLDDQSGYRLYSFFDQLKL